MIGGHTIRCADHISIVNEMLSLQVRVDQYECDKMTMIYYHGIILKINHR